MNILFVSDYYPNPKQPQFCIFIQQQAEALIRLGHKVEVIVPISTYSLKEKINEILLAGISVFYSEYFTLYKKIYSNIALKRNIKVYEKFFRFEQYDIISIHMFDEFTLRIFTEIAKNHNNKLVIHYHGLSILYDYPIPLLARVLQHRGDRVLKNLIAKADAIVGVSNKVCDRAKAVLINKNFFTVYNGVNTELFQPLIIKNNQKYTIICVASLKRIKGNQYLINAVKMLAEKYGDNKIKLFLIGHGPDKENLIEQIKNLNMENIVQMIGYIRYEEVAHIMAQGDVFAMPSFYEALGCVYLEAMACRLPVIACKYQGIDEIITDGQNGLLVEPHNTIQIFEKLDYLYQHKDISEVIALNGYLTALNRYTWLDSAKSLIEVYQNIV